MPQRIDVILDARGWTQGELAERAQIDKGKISRYISGEIQPNVGTLVRIASALGCRSLDEVWPMGPGAAGGEVLSARKARGSRRAEVSRKTSETDFTVSVDLDGSGRGSIATGIGFFDHMLNQIARHGLIDITVKGTGDLEVDAHHTVEDVGILLGQAIAKALGDRAGIRRFADVRLPMMDALAHVAIDAGGRGNLIYSARYPEARTGGLDTSLVREFFWSVATHAGIDLHIEVCYGENAHHMVEAVFKGFARAMRGAVALDPREPGVPSTKGVL